MQQTGKLSSNVICIMMNYNIFKASGERKLHDEVILLELPESFKFVVFLCSFNRAIAF